MGLLCYLLLQPVFWTPLEECKCHSSQAHSLHSSLDVLIGINETHSGGHLTVGPIDCAAIFKSSCIAARSISVGMSHDDWSKFRGRLGDYGLFILPQHTCNYFEFLVVCESFDGRVTKVDLNWP